MFASNSFQIFAPEDSIFKLTVDENHTYFQTYGHSQAVFKTYEKHS